MIEEYDWFKYLVSELSIGLHGFKERGRGMNLQPLHLAQSYQSYQVYTTSELNNFPVQYMQQYELNYALDILI